MRCASAVDTEQCSSGRLRQGRCEKHYRRWKKRGDVSPPRLNTFARYEVDANGCWLWTGPRWRNGYGKPSVEAHGTRLAHRAFYIEHRGPIRATLDLDHLCRVRHCVNPDHLQPVNRAENLIRGHAARTRCKTGRHDITEPGALRPGTFQCVACWRERYQAAGARYRARRRG